MSPILVVPKTSAIPQPVGAAPHPHNPPTQPPYRPTPPGSSELTAAPGITVPPLFRHTSAAARALPSELLQKIHSGEPLILDDITPSAAQAHYAGFDLFPRIDPELRAEVRDTMMALLHNRSEEEARLIVGRFDLAYAMTRHFFPCILSDSDYSRVADQSALLMSKIDVRDYEPFLRGMKVEVGRVQQHLQQGVPANFDERGFQAFTNYLEESLDRLARGGGLDYATLGFLCNGYTDFVGEFSATREFCKRSLDLGFSGFFPFVMLDPVFQEIIDRENYEKHLLYPWLAGLHVVGFLKAFEEKAFDGGPPVRGSLLSHHDAKVHSPMTRMSLDMVLPRLLAARDEVASSSGWQGDQHAHRDLLRRLAQPSMVGTRDLKTYLTLKLQLLKAQRRFQELLPNIEDPRVRETAKLLWCYFHREEFLFILFESFHEFIKLFEHAIKSKIEGNTSLDALTQREEHQGFFQRIKNTQDLGSLLSFPITELRLEAWIQAMDAIARSYGVISATALEEELRKLHPTNRSAQFNS